VLAEVWGGRGGVPVIENHRIVKLEDQRPEGVDLKSDIAC
jgi:hypothetical protein